MDRILPLATLPALLLAASVLTEAALTAQDAPTSQPAEQQIDAQALLHKAIWKMAQLNSVSFKTTESQDSAMHRMMAKQTGGMMPGPEDVAVRGTWSDGILHAKLNDGEDEIVMRRGRMVARNEDDGEWKLRRNRLYDGSALAFVLEPTLFFEVLTQLPRSALKIKHRDTMIRKDTELQVLSITLTGDAAKDFALAGTMPAVTSGYGGFLGRMGRMGGMGGMAKKEIPDITVDIAIYVDPKTAYVHRIRTSSYQAGGLPAGFTIQFGGAPGGDDDEEEEEDEEVKTRDATGKRIYKRGLPVRKLTDSLSKMRFDIRFSKHAQPHVFDLDADGRKLLKLPVRK